METFFSDVDDIPKFSENQAKPWEQNLTEKELNNSLKSMQSDKSPGNVLEGTEGNICRFCIRSCRKREFKYISKTGYH